MMALDHDTVAGFTPSPDCIRDDIDVVAANVFGAVWRFSKGQRGQCDATLATISKRAGYGTTATRMRLRLLVERGWIVEECRKGRPTVYRDSGRWVLKVVGEDTDTPTPRVGPRRKRQREALPSGGDPNASRWPPQRLALPPPTAGVGLPQREALAEDSSFKKEPKKEQETGVVVAARDPLDSATQVPAAAAGTATPGGSADPDPAPAPAQGATARRSRSVPKPVNPEDRAGPFRDVFRAICKVRRLDPDMLDDDTRSNTRRLTSRLCRKGVADGGTVEDWGRQWYAEMARQHRCRQSEVTPPIIKQLTTHFSGCIATRDGEVIDVPDTHTPARPRPGAHQPGKVHTPAPPEERQAAIAAIAAMRARSQSTPQVAP